MGWQGKLSAPLIRPLRGHLLPQGEKGKRGELVKENGRCLVRQASEVTGVFAGVVTGFPDASKRW